MKAAFHEQCADGPPWYFDGDRATVPLTCGQRRQPRRTLGQSAALRLDAACTDTVALTVKDTDLMGLRATINPPKPLIGEGMLRVLMAGVWLNRYSHDFLSSLSLAPR